MSTCVVSGTFLDPSGVAIANAAVRFNTDQPSYDSTLLNVVAPREVSTLTAADGTWSLTLSQNMGGTLTLDCPADATNGVVRYTFAVIVPSSPTATFSQVWADSQNLASATYPLALSMLTGTLTVAQLPALPSADIWVGDASNVASPVALTGDVSITNLGVATVTTVGGSTAANLHTAELAANAAASANTAGTIVKRDGSGNFSAGTITASVTGNVTGNVSGSAATITGNLTGDVTSVGMATSISGLPDSKLATIATAGKVSNSATTATSTNTVSAIVARDGSGNFSAGTITAALTGNVTGNVSGTAANVTGIVAIANGGTGQTAQAAAFDALSPNTTKGDITVRNSSTNVRVAIGSDGQVPVADSSQATGLAWKTLQQGSKNYITYNSFENNATTGWSLFNTTLTSLIPTGSITTSAASITTFATTATNPLSGTYSLQTASSAAWSAGQGFITDALPIDREDYKFGRVLTFTGRYEVVSGSTNLNQSGTSSNTLAVYLYDATNSAWIQPAGVYSMTGDGLIKGTFQIPNTCTIVRLAILAVNASGGAVTVNWDDFSLGPQSVSYGPPVTDMTAQGVIPLTGVSSNPTKGTVAKDAYLSGRVGDRLKLIYEYSQTGAGSAGSGNYLLGFNSGLSIDTSVYPQGTAVGHGFLFNGSNRGEATIRVYDSTHLYVSVVNNGGEGEWASAYFQLSGATIQFWGFAELPIVGWSSSLSMSADTDTRVVAFANNGQPTSSLTGSATVLKYPSGSVIKDTHAAYSATTGLYTVPSSGQYFVTGSARTGGTFGVATGVQMYIYQNGVEKYSFTTQAFSSSQTELSPHIAGVLDCVVGDTIAIYANSGATSPTFSSGDGNRFTVNRISGPAIVAATESVYAKYFLAGAVTISPTQPVNYATKAFDSHGAVTTGSSWKFTAPVSGVYSVSTALAMGSSANTLTIYKNGVADTYLGSASTTAYGGGTQLIKLVAGDYIDVRGDASSESTLSSTSQAISISRVGN